MLQIKKSKQTQEGSHREKILVAALVMLVVVFIGYTFSAFRKQIPQNTKPTVSESEEITTQLPKISQTEKLKDPTERIATSSATKLNSLDDGIGCSLLQKEACIITAKDPFIYLLTNEKDPDFTIDGEVVKPKRIFFYTNQTEYKENAITDAGGKIILSSNKTYDKSSGTLSVYVAITPSYFNLISSSQRRSLFMEQGMRAFMGMLGENPNNYIKVHEFSQQLTSWEPKNKK